jgi:hypothetical protein
MSETNPFSAEDSDRHAIWELLVRRDSLFFLSGDWTLVADDYIEAGFLGIDADKSPDPAGWRPAFPTLAAYRDAAIAARWSPADFAEPLRPAWFRCQSLERIDIAGEVALAHKRIDGAIARAGGEPLRLAWRSVFHLRRRDGAWKIAGFTGYLPL